MGVKPFSLPRDRVATETPSRPPTAQPPRDRASSTDNVTKRPPRKSLLNRAGLQIWNWDSGAAGGGLLAEMKLRQERAASLGRVSYPAIFRRTECSQNISGEIRDYE